MPAYDYDRRTAAELATAEDFIEELKKLLNVGDRLVLFSSKAIGSDTVTINYFNLPKSVAGTGAGAEASNNRVLIMVSGFGRDKVKVENLVYDVDGGSKLRAKTATPAVIVKYVADFLNKIAKEVPPKFTHSKPPAGY